MIENKFRNEINRESSEGLPVQREQIGDQHFGQFVSVNGLRLHYVSKGRGRPVVFIHGNPGSHHDYSMTVMSEVSQSYRAFAFDRPGHGYSERQDGRSTHVEVQARLLSGALRELNIEKPLVVGHSWGGAVALAMALECEEEISGLVLLAPAAYSSGSSNWWTPLAHVPWLGPLCIKTLTRVIGRHLIKESLRSAYHPQDIQTEYLKTAELLWLRPEQVKACADDDRSLNESLDRLRHRYPMIQLPVVIVTGDSDLLVKPEEHAERLHRTISGSRLIRLTETGHQILHTRPEAVCEAIKIAMRLVDSR